MARHQHTRRLAACGLGLAAVGITTFTWAAPNAPNAPGAEEEAPPAPEPVPITPLEKLADSTWRDGIGVVREASSPVAGTCQRRRALADCLELAQSLSGGACERVEELVSCSADEAAALEVDEARLAELRRMALEARTAGEPTCSAIMDKLAAQLNEAAGCGAEPEPGASEPGAAQGGPSPSSNRPPLPDDVPAIGGTDMSRLRLAAMGGVSYYQPLGNGQYGANVIGLIGYDFRESTSLVAPWIEAQAAFGPTFGDQANSNVNSSAVAAGLMGYVGVDYHPKRWRFLSVGPYIGAGPKLFASAADAADFRVDWLGSRLRFRTLDEDVDTLPLIEVDYKFFLRGSSAVIGAPHMGLSGSIGDDVRFITFVDVRLSQPGQAEIASAVSERVRAGIGAAWF